MKLIDFLKDTEFIGIIFFKHCLGEDILPQIAIDFTSLLE